MGGSKWRDKIGSYKMKRKFFIICSLCVASVWSLAGQTSDDGFTRALNNINQSVLKAQLGFLAS